uniref:dUTP pyrophosphatase n=1 Tax=Solanum tuberosum TaxID=4113 RepID=M1A2H5_SOLTU
MEDEKKFTKFAVQNGSVDICEVIKSYIPFLNVRRLSEKATLPKRMFPHSAAYDLFRYKLVVLVS